VYIKSPGEHTFNGLRYAVEMQAECIGEDGSKATFISLLEQNNVIGNDELKKLNFGNDYYTQGNMLKGQIVEFSDASFRLEQFYSAPQEYLMYIGSSTNDSCPSSLILISQSINWIGLKQI